MRATCFGPFVSSKVYVFVCTAILSRLVNLDKIVDLIHNLP